MRDYRRIGLAFLFAAAAFGITAFLQFHRDAIFAHNWAQDPTFRPDPDPTAEQAGLRALEKLHPGKTCLTDYVGRSESYLYLSGGCAVFRRGNAGVVEADGDPSYLAYRMSYQSGGEATHPEVVDSVYFENSLRRLYPRPAADLVRVRLNPDLFRQRGIRKVEGTK